MAWIIETPNPFQPTVGVKKHRVDERISIIEWLRQTRPGFIEFEHPTICLVNGHAVLRKDWVRTIQPADVINFITIPQGEIVFLIIAIVLAIVSVVITLLTAPKAPGETPASDPVFSNRGRQNTIRLGEPIECCYGRNRMYPSLASRPYYQYIGNDQFQYSLYCLGHGWFEIASIMIGDTDIDSYQEVEYEVVEPGEYTSLFPTNVYTAAEAGGQTIFAPNEPEDYLAPGWVGPFPANGSGSVTEKIQVDLVAPEGLYRINNDGGLDPRSITVEVMAREIDDSGSPIGSFEHLSFSPYTVTLATTTPQRRTLTSAVATGRYEVRIRRTTNKDLSYRAGHKVVWEGLRSFIVMDSSEQIDFGDVTLLAVKIRASNNLNDRTAQQVNVIATRKLPMYESGAFGDPVVTRSIVWAFVDVFRANYGGRLFEDNYFDWDALLELDELFAERGEYFDWIFRDPITVWEMAQTVAAVGRGVPLLVGSLVTMKRDGPLDAPTTIFTPDNIVAGSFSIDVKLWEIEEHDCLSIEYTDPETGYKQEQVTAVLPGGTTDNPRDIRVAGIQDRTHAYRYGMYLLASEKYLRRNVPLETGLEGYIPSYGDLVAVSHDVPRWGQSGYVVHAVAGDEGQYQVWLSEPVVWEESSNYQILFRKKNGDVLGPVNVYPTDNDQQVVVNLGEADFDFLLDGDTEPMLFLFGIEGSVTEYMRIVNIEPQGGEIIRLSLLKYDARVHSFDELEPPPLNIPSLPPVTPDLPEISRLFLSQIDGTLLVIQAAWSSAFGANYYLVQTSEDGEVWQDRASTTQTSVQLQVRAGPLWVRVAAIGNGQGPWIEEDTVVGNLAGLELSVEWDDLEWEVRWTEVLNCVGYSIKVYNNLDSEPILRREVEQSIDLRDFLYTYANAVTDANLVREMLVEVDVLFQDEDTGGILPTGNPVSRELSNTVPTAPTTLSATLGVVGGGEAEYDLEWDVPTEGDLKTVKVWVSSVNGFDPGLDVPAYEFTAGSPGYAGIPDSTTIAIALDSSGGHVTHYWRVALFDVWGIELTTNVSTQQTIAALQASSVPR